MYDRICVVWCNPALLLRRYEKLGEIERCGHYLIILTNYWLPLKVIMQKCSYITK